MSSRKHFLKKNVSYAQSARNAFTLIEVMIAVMIISVVIGAILQMRGNSSFIYEKIEQNSKINQYLSFFISNKDYGLEKKSTTMKNLCEEFELDSELRREFSSVKLNIDYKKSDIIDMSEFDEGSELVIETGRTILNINDSTASLIRIRIP
ncbi:MAG: prepilin-type N-terminal cleavage/methylation domain-containing protein [Thiovulaceae bacterium]|nr:prepilin-type N-terminal cleavage/methylation domain-containing protein [Sulfurimonadaceae bacterium]